MASKGWLRWFWLAQPEAEVVSFDELSGWLDAKLAFKYERGLRRILRALIPALTALSKLERLVLNIGGLVCSLEESECKQQVSLQGCKAAIDKCVRQMEHVRDFPTCTDYATYGRMVRSCRDIHNTLSDGQKLLLENGLQNVSPQSKGIAPCVRDRTTRSDGDRFPIVQTRWTSFSGFCRSSHPASPTLRPRWRRLACSRSTLER